MYKSVFRNKRLVVVSLCAAALPALLSAQTGVSIAFNGAGLNSLQYNGTQFLTYGDFRLNSITFQNQDGSSFAGSTASTVIVDSVQQTQTRAYSWGTITVKYVPSGTRLNLTATVANKSSATIQQFWCEPMGLGFPSAVVNYDGSNPILANTLGQPAVVAMNYSSGVLVAASDDVTRPVQIGFPYAFNKPANTSFPLTINTGSVSTYPDSLPYITRLIPPGGTDQFPFSLRFGPPDSTTVTLAPDVYQSFAAAYPATLNWPDRRPIGQIIIATAAAGYPKNPRGWFLDPYLDVTTPAGVASFQQTLLNYANNCISILKSMGAQGMITWDIEGEQYPHPITYAGDPRQFASLAPEMAAIADQYFALFRTAGLRVGVTLRPQQLTVSADGSSAQQIPLTNPTQLLIDKATYAHSRWGATIFYIDSNVNVSDPNPIDPNIIKTLSTLFPDSLFIPEHSNTQYFAYSAPYREVKQGYFSTPADVRFTYPNAFTVLYTADGPLSANYNTLVTAVSQGDVLLYRTWYNDPQNAQVLAIYQAAHPTTGSVTIAPLSVSLFAGQTVQFTANQPVNWSATLGSVSPSGLYTAPPSIPTQQVATVKAASSADPSKSATASVSLNPVAVVITPATATLSAGQTAQFTASVTGSTNQQVTWRTTLGTISAAGFYTAPATVSQQQSATVTATSIADPAKSNTATIVLNPGAVVACGAAATNAFTGCYYKDRNFGTLALSRVDPQINFNWTNSGPIAGQNFNYSVRWQGNFTFNAATYNFTLATDDGSRLSIDGRLLIDNWSEHAAIPVSQSIALTAGSHLVQVEYFQLVGNAAALLTWTAAAAPIQVAVNPPTVTLGAGQSQQFTATVSNTANQQVAWTATAGSISSTGLYAAPAAISVSTPVTVTATSQADPSKSALAAITLTATSSAACAPPATNAFAGCYYSDRSFTTPVFSRVDPAINFNWPSGPGSGIGPSNYSVRWVGYFSFNSGNYRFTVATDDGSQLWIDGVLVLDNWGEHPAIPVTKLITLNAGQHQIRLDYYQLTGTASASLSWKSE